MTALLSILLAFAYRIRGGGWVQLHDFEYRLIWGLSLGLAYIFMNPHNPDLFYAVLLVPLAYIAMLVPHAYCQNMGYWSLPQNKWPSFFLPKFTQIQWLALPRAARTLNDLIAMAAVSFFRAAIVFLPYLATKYALHHVNALHGVLVASLVLIIGQPLAYISGLYVPFEFPSLTQRSTEWSEFLNGAVYGVCLWLL